MNEESLIDCNRCNISNVSQFPQITHTHTQKNFKRMAEITEVIKTQGMYSQLYILQLFRALQMPKSVQIERTHPHNVLF